MPIKRYEKTVDGQVLVFRAKDCKNIQQDALFEILLYFFQTREEFLK